MKVTAIITAAGNSTRFNGNKMFTKIDDVYIIQKTLDAFIAHEKINNIVLTYNPLDKEKLKELKTDKKPVTFVEGGSTRTASIKLGLYNTDCDIVLIHDGARPYVTKKIITDCIEGVKKNKSAVCAIPVTDTVAEVSGGMIGKNLDRESLYHIQTPQGFIFKDILKAYETLNENESCTDDSQVYKKLFEKVYIFLGSAENIKITYPDDIKKA